MTQVTTTEGSEQKKGTAVGPGSSNVKPIDGTRNGDLAKAQAAGEAQRNGADDSTEAEDKAVGPSFDPAFMQHVVAAQEKLYNIASRRSELNSEANAVIAGLEKYGLNKHAVRAAIKYHGMDPKQRETYDLSYAVARKALGQPLQDDLFVVAAQRAVDQHKSKH